MQSELHSALPAVDLPLPFEAQGQLKNLANGKIGISQALALH